MNWFDLRGLDWQAAFSYLPLTPPGQGGRQ